MNRAKVDRALLVQQVLEGHYGTWRADGDPEWADVARVVVDGLQESGHVLVSRPWLDRLKRLVGPA